MTSSNGQWHSRSRLWNGYSTRPNWSRTKSPTHRRERLCYFLILFFLFPIVVHAKHLRIFACAIANDSAGAFMGGSSNGSGIYQSDDTGKTWKHLGWDNIKCYSMDEVHSSNGRILYEATGLGILRSTDYGAHWKQLTDWRISEVMDVAVNQRSPGILYIATAHGAWRILELGWDSVDETPVQLDTANPYCSRVIYKHVGGEDRFLFKCVSRMYETSSFLTHWTSYFELQDIRNVKEWTGDFDLREIREMMHDTLIPTNLTGRQIWTLKSFLVTP